MIDYNLNKVKVLYEDDFQFKNHENITSLKKDKNTFRFLAFYACGLLMFYVYKVYRLIDDKKPIPPTKV